MSKEFCRWCGKEKIPEATKRFDIKTGKPEFELICPDACKHGLHKLSTAPRGVFASLFGRLKCERCGGNYFDGDDY
jgi:hypothetical protein